MLCLVAKHAENGKSTYEVERNTPLGLGLLQQFFPASAASGMLYNRTEYSRGDLVLGFVDKISGYKITINVVSKSVPCHNN